jgi:hypothetical protein
MNEDSRKILTELDFHYLRMGFSEDDAVKLIAAVKESLAENTLLWQIARAADDLAFTVEECKEYREAAFALQDLVAQAHGFDKTTEEK